MVFAVHPSPPRSRVILCVLQEGEPAGVLRRDFCPRSKTGMTDQSKAGAVTKPLGPEKDAAKLTQNNSSSVFITWLFAQESSKGAC